MSRHEGGFSLIEMIVVLVLVGIVSSVIGLALVQGVQGYLFAGENVEMSEKAGLALGRIDRELTRATGIDADASGSSCIRYKVQTESQHYRALGIDGDSLRLHVSNSSDGGCPIAGSATMLADNVDSFSLIYQVEDGGNSTSPPVAMEDVHAIAVRLSLEHVQDAAGVLFEETVVPRNNGLLNAPGSR
jgi:prepilin-type N-terminal cleavage/methylation domain-containing protein